ncbi:MAG: PKD domain-containing protein [Saprospiraceae bacterium]|nr:PKD domain-containing protein [Saprospiraceae bacterium]
MRISIFYMICILGVSSLTLKSQGNTMIIPDISHQTTVVNKGSAIKKTQLSATAKPSSIKSDWNVVLRNLTSFNHTSPIPTKEFKKLKQKINNDRFNNANNLHPQQETASKSVTQPFLNRNFRGNSRDQSVPMDNSIAVSRNGFIVSAVNTNIIFTGPDGVITFQKGFSDFFTLLGLGTRMYDPRIIYDVEENRFIFMCLHGSEPSTTQLCIAFSKTEDPNGEWNYYKIDGNPSGDQHWFDYPNIAITKNDLYIAGLMRDVPGDWSYSVLYQIDKKAGFQGNEVLWKYYNDIKNADGLASFNLVPTPSGWNYLPANGMYFVSNQALGGDTYHFYYTTGSLNTNPSLVSMLSKGLAIEIAPDGRQKQTSNILNTFDSRIWSALYHNGVIHMGTHVKTPNGDVGLFYGRMDVSSLKVEADILTSPGKDYAFPSFSAFGQKETDAEILVNYLVSGADLFPGQEQRLCSGANADFLWSEPVTLKEGLSIINARADNNERWGDYTTSSRRFINDRVESWVTGSFGEQNSYGTWLGQYVSEESFNTIPMAEFVSDKTTAPKNTEITFNDITQKNPISWQWTFEGGVPSSSSDLAPKVIFPDDGAYDITLIVTNDLGTDTLTKIEYIHIQDTIAKPVAQFIMDQDTIFKNDSIQFLNLSSDDAVTFKWAFQSGNPSSSTLRDPVVKYNNVGSFLVSLTAANIAGSNTKIIQKAVTVLNRFAPVAAFTADKTNIATGESIMFSDISTGGPKSREWAFEGGSPASSSIKNPVIRYDQNGTFEVSLKVMNEFGENTTVKTGYIMVGEVNTVDLPLITKIKLYPNPVSEGTVTLNFEIDQTQKLRFSLNDVNGKIIRLLYHDRVKTGQNQFSFNADTLISGIYFLKITDEAGKNVAIPVVVQNGGF